MRRAKPLGNVKLTLVARDNNVLATVTTNSDGRADFDPGLFKATGGDEPVVVMAYGASGDFSFLDLRRPAFDLTDRGVGGTAFARTRRRLSLYRARRLSPRRDGASGRNLARHAWAPPSTRR